MPYKPSSFITPQAHAGKICSFEIQQKNIKINSDRPLKGLDVYFVSKFLAIMELTEHARPMLAKIAKHFANVTLKVSGL